MRLKIHASNCTICNLCSLACSFHRAGKLCLDLSAVRVTPDFPDSLKVKVNFCIQCRQEYCVQACPIKALKRQEDGRVTIDNSLCDTCHGEYKCVSACKYKGIFNPGDGTAPIKCDLCNGNPECVKVCPLELISVV